MYRVLCVAVFLAIGVNPVHGSPVALGSVMELNTRIRLFCSGAVEPCEDVVVTDTETQSQVGAAGPLAVSVSAFAELLGSAISTTGQGSATWVSTAAGSISFSNIGWTSVDVGTTSNGVSEGEARLANLGSATNPNWSYTFIADATGLFTMNYAIEGTADSFNGFGLQGFLFLDPLHVGGRIAELNTAGSFTMAMVAGQTYTVGIDTTAVVGGAFGSREALMSGEFNWSMDTEEQTEQTPVPEPSSFLLLGGGVLAVAVRRQYVWRRARRRIIPS